MSDNDPTLKQQAEKMSELANEIDPTDDIAPDSVAEATTMPLEDGQLGGHATQEDAK